MHEHWWWFVTLLVLAVVNSEHESLEIWQWVNVAEDQLMRVEKQMATIARRLYFKLSRETNHQIGMVAVGHSEESEPNDPKKRKNMIHYALYQGKCLDPERFSYFLPERTIEEDTLTLDEVRKLLT